MASADYFLKIGDIKGESLDKAHRGSIEVLSWSWGASQLGTVPPASSSGKVSMSPFVFTKRIDKATPILLMSAGDHKSFPNVELSVRTRGRQQLEYLKLTFTDCLVSSIQGQTAEPRLPTEMISLNFLKVELRVQQFTANRLIGAPGEGEFVETPDGAAG